MFLLVGGAFLLGKNSSTRTKNSASDKPSQEEKNPSSPKDNPKPNQPDKPDNSDNNSAKKTLAKQIKADLEAETAKLKSGQIKSREVSIVPTPHGPANKYLLIAYIRRPDRKTLIEHTDLEPADWDEIGRKLSQFETLREEKERQEQAEIDRKLTQNSSLFSGIGSGGTDLKPGYQDNFSFCGKEKGRDYRLLIPSNHSALTLANINDKTWREKHGLYVITGVDDNIPLECHVYNGRDFYYKFVKLTDKIMIVPYSG